MKTAERQQDNGSRVKMFFGLLAGTVFYFVQFSGSLAEMWNGFTSFKDRRASASSTDSGSSSHKVTENPTHDRSPQEAGPEIAKPVDLKVVPPIASSEIVDNRPIHVVVVLENTGRPALVKEVGRKAKRLVETLKPSDRVSMIAFVDAGKPSTIRGGADDQSPDPGDVLFETLIPQIRIDRDQAINDAFAILRSEQSPLKTPGIVVIRATEDGPKFQVWKTPKECRPCQDPAEVIALLRSFRVEPVTTEGHHPVASGPGDPATTSIQ